MRTLPISVVIPTMNRPDSLRETLTSIFSKDTIPSELIIIDQSSTPVIRDNVKQVVIGLSALDVSVKLIQQKEASLTKARNLGISIAKNDIIIFCDDDIHVNNETCLNIYTLMEDKQISMIAGIDELTNKCSSKLGYIAGTKSYINRNIGHVTLSMLGRYPDNVSKETSTQWAMGYFFVVRLSLIKKWELRFDEKLSSYAYAEDLDFTFSYFKQSRVEGLKCILHPLVSVRHLASLEFRHSSKRTIYMYVLNRTYLSHKHKMGLLSFICTLWSDCFRVVEQLFSNRANALIYIKAILCKYKHYNKIIKGELDYTAYLK